MPFSSIEYVQFNHQHHWTVFEQQHPCLFKPDRTLLVQWTFSEHSLETPASSSPSETWAGLIWAPLCAHGLLDRCVTCGEPDAAGSEEYWPGQTQTRKSPDVSVERSQRKCPDWFRRATTWFFTKQILYRNINSSVLMTLPCRTVTLHKYLPTWNTSGGTASTQWSLTLRWLYAFSSTSIVRGDIQQYFRT